MNCKLKNFPRNGFTLIELLIVITIIVVISAVAMVNYTGAAKKARDSRRVSDLEKIRMALETVRQVGVTYPNALGILVTGNYVSKLPTDPKTDGNYLYTPGDTNYSYTLDATMEDLGTTNGSYGSYNYRVTNL